MGQIENKKTVDLKGQFLIAMPSVQDPFFYKSVVYICEHDDEGSVGLTINQPLDLTVGKILEQFTSEVTNYHLTPQLIQPVFSGGPVFPDRGFVIHPPLKETFASTVNVSDSIQITTSKDILSILGKSKEPEDYLVALGFAEWRAGQLEHELQNNTWLITQANEDILFHTPVEQRWNKAIQQLGINPLHLSENTGHA